MFSSIAFSCLFQTVDENFNREENKFKCLDRAIRMFVKNVSTYMEQMRVRVPFFVILHILMSVFLRYDLPYCSFSMSVICILLKTVVSKNGCPHPFLQLPHVGSLTCPGIDNQVQGNTALHFILWWKIARNLLLKICTSTWLPVYEFENAIPHQVTYFSHVWNV
jgi:hypothetical protein